MNDTQPKHRTAESADQRVDRLHRDAQNRRAQMVAEDNALDAMVKRSIELHGP